MPNREVLLYRFTTRFECRVQKTQTSLLLLLLICLCLLPGNVAFSQTAAAATYPRQELIRIAKQMLDQAGDRGSNSDALERHLDSATILAVRTSSGRAEFHAASADAFFVVEGHATLVTGGTIVNPAGTTEIRGESIRGGTRAELSAGDVVHIPAKTPHQLLLSGQGDFVYVLVKIPAD
jgi:mannose-6-phosphate isomerase-like protein (cupin superfamily)